MHDTRVPLRLTRYFFLVYLFTASPHKICFVLFCDYNVTRVLLPDIFPTLKVIISMHKHAYYHEFKVETLYYFIYVFFVKEMRAGSSRHSIVHLLYL